MIQKCLKVPENPNFKLSIVDFRRENSNIFTFENI